MDQVAEFNIVGTVTSGMLGQHHTAAEMWFDGSELVVQNHLGGGTSRLLVTGSNLAEVDSQTETLATPMTSAKWYSGTTLSIAARDLEAVANYGGTGSLTIYADQSGQFVDALEALSAQVAGQTLIFLAEPSDGGIISYRYEADGSLTRRDAQWDQDDSYMRGVAAMSTVELDGTTYLIAAGANDNGVAALRVESDGKLTPVSALGYDEFLPVYTVTNVQAVQTHGKTYILVTASDTSSLSVLELAADGTLSAVDQVMDERGTRFQGATTLETFAHGDHTYVLVSGQDDGISLFTLLPNGRVVHVASIADSNDASLSNITNIEVVPTGDVFQIFVTSSFEHGVTQITLDLGAPGIIAEDVTSVTGDFRDDVFVAADGGASIDARWGDDILVDGDGFDTLTGGGGSDLFILGADGQEDVITDFDIGEDRLDLSAWGYLRDISQITVTSTSNGAVLSFNGNSVRLISDNGKSLSAAQFSTATILDATHVDLSYVGTPFLFPDEEPSGSGGDDEITGGDGDQVISAGAGDDILEGGEGADELRGGNGFDVATYENAGAGVAASLSDAQDNTGQAEGDTYISIEGLIGTIFADDLTGDDTANMIDGRESGDVIRALGGDDSIYGDVGFDWIDAGAGNDYVEGGKGNDSILGRAGNDTIYGGSGADNIAAHEGDDTVYGGSGNDSLGGSYGNDVMYGEDGDDVIGSGPDDDLIDAGAGNDIASGGWGTDEVLGGSGNDTLAGSYGVDVVRGGSGDDSLGGGTGNDKLYGDDGDDLLGAGDDDDKLWGGSGNDFLGGGAGDDVMYGGAGQDTLNSGDGNDVMWGGDGEDIFVFNSFTASERDIIRDFTLGEDLLRMKYVAGRFDGLEITDITTGGKDYAQITYGGHKIRLENVEADDLSVSDFIFLG